MRRRVCKACPHQAAGCIIVSQLPTSRSSMCAATVLARSARHHSDSQDLDHSSFFNELFQFRVREIGISNFGFNTTDRHAGDGRTATRLDGPTPQNIRDFNTGDSTDRHAGLGAVTDGDSTRRTDMRDIRDFNENWQATGNSNSDSGDSTTRLRRLDHDDSTDQHAEIQRISVHDRLRRLGGDESIERHAQTVVI